MGGEFRSVSVGEIGEFSVEIEAKMSDTRQVSSERASVVQTDGAPKQDPIAKDDQEMPSPKSTRSPAFQFYASDFLSGDKVARMSYTEIGIFTVLLAHAWLSHGLPSDVGEIAKILKMNPQRFGKIWRGVLSECWIKRGARLVNRRQEAERAKRDEFLKRQSDNGSKGGRPKGLGLSGLTHSKARALKSEEILDLSSVKKRDGDIQRRWGAAAVRDLPEAPYDHWFVAFRDAYHPRGRVDNPIVRDAFMAVFTKSEAEPEQIFADLLAAVRNHAAGDQWARGMVPAMLKWLDEGYYLQRHDPPKALVVAGKPEPEWVQRARALKVAHGAKP